MKSFILLILLAVSGSAMASDATDVMVEILAELNHFPSEDDHSFLDEILASGDATSEEKQLAAIIKRVQHKAAAEDVSALIAIEKKSADPAVRVIAGAVLSIDHKPSEAYLARLNKIIDGD